MKRTLVATLAFALPLAAASAAFAGPGALPSHLLRPAGAASTHAPYALTGTIHPAGTAGGWTAHAALVGGARDQRTVFERGR